jgi:hypothetical protein
VTSPSAALAFSPADRTLDSLLFCEKENEIFLRKKVRECAAAVDPVSGRTVVLPFMPASSLSAAGDKSISRARVLARRPPLSSLPRVV